MPRRWSHRGGLPQPLPPVASRRSARPGGGTSVFAPAIARCLLAPCFACRWRTRQGRGSAPDRLPNRASALLASVALDHVSALPAFVALTTVIIGVLGVRATPNREALVTIASITLVCVIAAIGIRVFRKAWHDRLVAYAMSRLRAPGTSRAALVSVPMLVAHYGIFVCTAQAFAVPAPAFGLFGASVIADSIASLPITIAGIGVREKAFEVLLGSWYAVPTALAVLTSLSGLLVLALWAVVGVLAFPVRGHAAPLETAAG